MQITATFDSIEEMRNFAAEMAGKQSRPETAVREPEKTRDPEKKKKEADPVSDEAGQGITTPVGEDSQGENGEEAPGYTKEDVRARLTELNRSGKRKEVAEILASVGAAKLSEVDPSDYGAIMRKAGEV